MSWSLSKVDELLVLTSPSPQLPDLLIPDPLIVASTLTHLAEHLQQFTHDTINRYLSGENLTPRLRWENVQPLIATDAAGYLIFDDTVLNQRFSQSIALVRRQYSGNEHRVH
jgi:hypothetical protein